MRQAFRNHNRHPSLKHPQTHKKPSGLNSSQSSRPQSKPQNQKNVPSELQRHTRHPASDHPLKSHQFIPTPSSVLKSFIRKSIQSPSQRKQQQKMINSAVYKKLLLQLQNMKKNYSKQITDLRSQIVELDEQIVSEKNNLLALIKKRQKMEKDVNKYTAELIQMQQTNYEMYWDVAARINQEEQDQTYEELLELEEEAGFVSRGLDQEQIDKLIIKWSKQKKQKKQCETQNPEQAQTCCICCHNLESNQQIVSLPCGHSHHNSCIKQWLVYNKVCPLCRKEVLP